MTFVSFEPGKPHADFRSFTMAAKKSWPSVHRIVLGRAYIPGRAPVMMDWAEGNASGMYSYSLGGEVFIFEKFADAILFKLRWQGDTDIANGKDEQHETI